MHRDIARLSPDTIRLPDSDPRPGPVIIMNKHGRVIRRMSVAKFREKHPTTGWCDSHHVYGCAHLIFEGKTTPVAPRA